MYFKMKYKLLTICLLGILMVSFASAWEWDNVKKYNKDTQTITLTNALGLGSIIAKYKLTDNSDQCLIDCYAEGTADLRGDNFLFQDIKFKDVRKNIKKVNNKIFIQVENTKTTKIQTYGEKENCINLINGTKSCSKIQNGTKDWTITTYKWKEYNGEILPEGIYKWRLEGKKGKDESVDWITSSNGFDLTEWAWWENSWDEKKIINITETSGGTLANYSVLLNVSYDSDMSADFSDLRFTNSTEDGELNYWIENKTDSNFATVWVFLDDLTASSLTQIYMYYGNAGASTTSSIKTAFRFGDDFNDASLDTNLWWINTGSTATEINGEVQIEGAAVAGSNQIHGTRTSNTNFTEYPYKLTLRVKNTDTANHGWIGTNSWIHGLAGQTMNMVTLEPSSNWMRTVKSDNYVTLDNVWGANNYYKGEIITFANGTMTAGYDGVGFNHHESNAHTNPYRICFADWTGGGGNISVDYVYLNGWATTLPTIAFGSEESKKIEVTLNSPLDNSESLNSITFNATAEVNLASITNMSLWTNETGSWEQYNVTTKTGTTNTTTWDRKINEGIIWNVQSCNSNGECNFASHNYSLKIVNILVSNHTHNTTTQETASEIFQIGVIANSSLTAVTLDYNGTDYSLTDAGGGIWNTTIDIPLSKVQNNTIKYDFTYGGNEINSEYFYQNVEETIFILCNATYSNDFLNITFKDEADSSNINASIPTSSFIYYLGSGTVTKEYTYINNTDHYNYLFCATPDRTLHVDAYLQYKRNSDYPQRIWNPSVQDYTSTLSTQILYLLESADGIYVTLQVVNSATQLISGVYITATREIGGTDTIVASGTTGSDGTVTFWLNPDFSHDFELTKTGYTDYSTTFTPTQTSYTITIGDVTETENSSIRGIDYSIIPTNSYLVNDTSYTFGFNLTSSYWEVDEYGFNLRLSNGTEFDGGHTGVEGTDLTKIYNVNNQTIIYLDYYWLINDVYTNSSRYWIIQNTELTGWSIANFFTDLNLYLDSEIYGLDNFGRSLIVFLILFISIGIMSYKYGATSPLAISSLIFGIIFFFDVVVGLIPTIRGIEYLPTFLAFLILTLAIFNEVKT